ncbi:MAG: nuclear transport factor 2 family protein [Acidimicrobiia bacterium]|nr:nuclear transport factor 2 family protein [Acidimicrobiia bacterium]
MIGTIRQALLTNELPAAEQALDDATMLHLPGRSGLAGDYQGREPILALFARMNELTEGTCRFSPSRVLADTGTAFIVRGVQHAVRGNRTLSTPAVHIFSLSDCTIRDIWILHEDQHQVDEFWAGG